MVSLEGQYYLFDIKLLQNCLRRMFFSSLSHVISVKLLIWTTDMISACMHHWQDPQYHCVQIVCLFVCLFVFSCVGFLLITFLDSLSNKTHSLTSISLYQQQNNFKMGPYAKLRRIIVKLKKKYSSMWNYIVLSSIHESYPLSFKDFSSLYRFCWSNYICAV